MSLNDYIADDSCTVAKALSALEQNDHKVLILLDKKGALSGVVTDGDIRRFLLRDGDLGKSAAAAASKTPVTVTGYHERQAREMLSEREITCVPMLDAGGAIHALVFDDQTLHRVSDDIGTRAIIMAGGLGTRLWPYTEILPKPLIPVGHATITELIIRRFLKFGCRDITLVVNHRKNLIKSYFSEVERDYNLDFADEDVPLGTGGGLAFFKGRTDRPVFVTYCDNVVEADYRDILRYHEENQNLITMVAAEKTERVPYGVVETDGNGRLLDIREKPERSYLINAGFYLVSPGFIDRVENGKFQHITDLMLRCRRDGLPVGVYRIGGECFIDAGQIGDLKLLGEKLR